MVLVGLGRGWGVVVRIQRRACSPFRADGRHPVEMSMMKSEELAEVRDEGFRKASFDACELG
jgi:hypothetical protein